MKLFDENSSPSHRAGDRITQMAVGVIIFDLQSEVKTGILSLEFIRSGSQPVKKIFKEKPADLLTFRIFNRKRLSFLINSYFKPFVPFGFLQNDLHSKSLIMKFGCFLSLL